MQGKKRAKYADGDVSVQAHTLTAGRKRINFDLAQEVIIMSQDSFIQPFKEKVHLWLTTKVCFISKPFIVVFANVSIIATEEEDRAAYWSPCCQAAALL